ncbi:ELM1/GtrOC1 family putative glycosyltransferase [Nitrincola nitratireducens]|uniref:Uncharacterized protein n=1 Tax=Nitrincola nitratireducens TaxID=1229521 RepID=W9VPI3_9GAMM|nr:ELM1/GtrOC1 family putative glycosyltransferase [Nitrincola nitratireducens]EXJ12345.1 hypothetical protein D791_00590 [Nitrincola nitratireducens]
MAVVRIINDGKPGHVNQSMGLVKAMQRLRPDLQYEVISPLSFRESLQAGVFKSYRHADIHQERPCLLIGAGHKTHLTLLALKAILMFRHLF